MYWYQRNRRCDISRKDHRKKDQPKQKEKEFSAAPFKALKGVQLTPPAKAAAPAPKQPEKPKEEAVDDLSLFFEAVSGAKPLHPVKGPAKKEGAPAPEKTRVSEEENRIFLQAVEALRMDVRFSDGAVEEELPQRPVAVNRLRQVRRGSIRLDLQLDLHGLTRDEALDNLAPFIVRAHARGQKGVLVITGKGNNSNGEPVLRQAVAGWLREQGKGMVAEFAQAPREMGGSGAFVVFLKEKKEEPEQQG